MAQQQKVKAMAGMLTHCSIAQQCCCSHAQATVTQSGTA